MAEFIKRLEIEGHEGGTPPIHLEFWEGPHPTEILIGDDRVGTYILKSLGASPIVSGPMFVQGQWNGPMCPTEYLSG